MPTYTEAQIRTAAEAEIQAAASTAVVFPWWNLDPDVNMWPGQLIPETGADAGKVHGYVLTPARIITIGGDDTGRVNTSRTRFAFGYDIIGIHYQDTGTRTANSDQKFVAELRAICERFANATAFKDTALARSHVPTFPVIDLRMIGGALRHFTVGSLTVEQC